MRLDVWSFEGEDLPENLLYSLLFSAWTARSWHAEKKLLFSFGLFLMKKFIKIVAQHKAS